MNICRFQIVDFKKLEITEQIANYRTKVLVQLKWVQVKFCLDNVDDIKIQGIQVFM